MSNSNRSSRILIVGCTGYIGKHIASASIRLGYPTFLLVRPDTVHDAAKCLAVIAFKRAGAKIVEASFDDQESLVEAVKQVDIVISTMPEKQIDKDQIKLIEAIKLARNIKRFLPSEFGMDPARMDNAISPGNGVFMAKMKARKAIEQAGIPYTYVSANCFAGYFVAGIAQLGRFMPPRDKIVLYGDGNAKVIWVDEDDVGTYVVKSADDERTLGKTVYIRPPKNLLSQREVLGLWEEKIGKKLEKSYMSEEEILQISRDEEKYPFPFRAAVAHFYQIFYKGDLVFEIGPEGCDTAELYPEVEYTTVSSYLDRYV